MAARPRTGRKCRQDGAQAHPAQAQSHQQVIDDVGRLASDALRAFAAKRPPQLVGLFAQLGRHSLRARVEQAPRVASLCGAARPGTDDAFQCLQERLGFGSLLGDTAGRAADLRVGTATYGVKF